MLETTKKRGRPKKVIHSDIAGTVTLPAKTNEVKVELQLGPLKFEQSGLTVFDALSSFPLEFFQVKVNGTFRIYRGNAMYERYMRLFQIRKILRSPVNRKWWAGIFEKNLDILEKK